MSLMLNLGESVGNHRGNRRLRLETASGSAGELRRALRFGALWGHFERPWAQEMDRDLDRVMAMLWRSRARSDDSYPAGYPLRTIQHAQYPSKPLGKYRSEAPPGPPRRKGG